MEGFLNRTLKQINFLISIAVENENQRRKFDASLHGKKLMQQASRFAKEVAWTNEEEKVRDNALDQIIKENQEFFKGKK